MSDTAPTLNSEVLAPATAPTPVLADLITEAAAGCKVRFRAGQTIIQQGDASTHVVLLRDGAAKVVLQTASAEIVLGLRAAPEILGERAVLDGTPRSASVVALTDVAALAVPAEDFLTLVTEHPKVATAVFAVIAERLCEADRGRVDLATHTVTQRVAARLVALTPWIGVAEEETGAVRLPLTQQDLAGWVGASREAIVRTLRLLREAGVVTTERRQIVIRSLDALRTKMAG
ncbi:Crp/Fnr family transcriptional regulator [Kitasatospora sp. NPDC101155]|uniref:Crp/Fnr family transcriptional regulator n=1 Tax=Kitasatospora sp. NPDC101155 TaxID=3364097 RepID=UPI00380CE937